LNISRYMYVSYIIRADVHNDNFGISLFNLNVTLFLTQCKNHIGHIEKSLYKNNVLNTQVHILCKKNESSITIGYARGPQQKKVLTFIDLQTLKFQCLDNTSAGFERFLH